jgi:hypothetical protein
MASNTSEPSNESPTVLNGSSIMLQMDSSVNEEGKSSRKETEEDPGPEFSPIIDIDPREFHAVLVQHKSTMQTFIVQLFVYVSLYKQMAISAMPDVSTAASVRTILYAMTLLFMASSSPQALF